MGIGRKGYIHITPTQHFICRKNARSQRTGCPKTQNPTLCKPKNSLSISCVSVFSIIARNLKENDPPLRSLLHLTRRRWMRSRRFCIGSMISRHILSQARQRDRAGGEMDEEQPKAQAVDGVVHLVRVRHPVSRCEDGETKH